MGDLGKRKREREREQQSRVDSGTPKSVEAVNPMSSDRLAVPGPGSGGPVSTRRRLSDALLQVVPNFPTSYHSPVSKLAKALAKRMDGNKNAQVWLCIGLLTKCTFMKNNSMATAQFSRSAHEPYFFSVQFLLEKDNSKIIRTLWTFKKSLLFLKNVFKKISIVFQ